MYSVYDSYVHTYNVKIVSLKCYLLDLKNSCLVVLHCPYIILKNWKKVLTVYIKYTLNRIPKEFFNHIKTKIWTETCKNGKWEKWLRSSWLYFSFILLRLSPKNSCWISSLGVGRIDSHVSHAPYMFYKHRSCTTWTCFKYNSTSATLLAHLVVA